MEKVLLSIIVPVYNVKAYLFDCIESICNQSFTGFEVIVVDDGSTDGSGKLCDELAQKKDRIKVIHSENQGLAKARNLGLKYSNGEYIGFVDSDDMIHPQFYEILINEALLTGADTVSCSYDTVNDITEADNSFIDENIVFERMNSKEFISDFWNRAFLKIGVPQWCSIYKSSMFKRFGVNTLYRYYEDLNTLPDILENSNTVSFTEKKLYHYRTSGKSITRSPMNQDKIDKLGSWKNRIIPFLERNCDKESVVKGYQAYIDRYEAIAIALCRESRNDINISSEYRRYLYRLIIHDKKLCFSFTKESMYNAAYYLLLMVDIRLWYRLFMKNDS